MFDMPPSSADRCMVGLHLQQAQARLEQIERDVSELTSAITEAEREQPAIAKTLKARLKDAEKRMAAQMGKLEELEADRFLLERRDSTK